MLDPGEIYGRWNTIFSMQHLWCLDGAYCQICINSDFDSNKNKMGHDFKLWYWVKFQTGINMNPPLGQHQRKLSSINSQTWQCKEINWTWRFTSPNMGTKAVNIHLNNDRLWYPSSKQRAWSLLLWPLESDENQETERKAGFRWRTKVWINPIKAEGKRIKSGLKMVKLLKMSWMKQCKNGFSALNSWSA